MSDNREPPAPGCGRVKPVELDLERCWRAVQSRDPRFDGWFFGAVTTTGIYCRPSCPARPLRANMRFFPTAAAAQAAGFRACKRCRPDAAPGSPEWNSRSDLVGRAMRLIADGTVDRVGVEGLAARLGYTPRHVHRLLVAEVGAGPQALARAQRAQTARILLETTRMRAADVAFASGFASVRQFNDTIRDIFGVVPTALRPTNARPGGVGGAAVSLRLAYREPFDAAGLWEFLRRRAVPGVEDVVGGAYRRSLALPHGSGVVEVSPGAGHVQCVLQLAELRDLATAVARTRRLLDLDADPQAVDDVLGGDPVLGPLVSASPGVRVPGAVDPAEMAVRAVVGQQVSVAAAAGTLGRLVSALGTPLPTPDGTVTRLFPSMAALADCDPATLPMPRARARAVQALADAIAQGRVDLGAGCDRAEVTRGLLDQPGIGPWTTSYVAMRALGDPDTFLSTDLGVRRALEQVGRPTAPEAVESLAHRWRPWRSYAVMHLWRSLDAGAPADRIRPLELGAVTA